MRRATRLAAAALAVAVLGGCATGTPVEPDPDRPIGRYSTVEAMQPGAQVDQSYLATMRRLDLGAVFSGDTDAELIDAGKSFCANGADSSGLAEGDAVRAHFGLEPNQLRVILHVMAVYYCADKRGDI